MLGKVLEYKVCYYCDFFRIIVFFWLLLYGKMVIVFDEELEMDYEFGEIVIRYIWEYFLEYKLEVFFELLLNDKSILENFGLVRCLGYNC